MSHLITWVLSVLIAIDVVIFLIALVWTLIDTMRRGLIEEQDHMIFDDEKGDKGLVKDALGYVIFHPIKGDTLTGRVVCYVPSGVGNEILLDGDDGLVREIHVYRAPLSVSPLGDFRQSEYPGPWATPIYREKP